MQQFPVEFPQALSVDQWRATGGPDYAAIFRWRQHQLSAIRSSPIMMMGAKEYYRTHFAEFIMHFITTHDPRNAGKPSKIATMPFVMFKRQYELVQFLDWCRKHDNRGLVVKSRDMGATWICAAYSVCLWLFTPDCSVSWGSRKEMLIDRIGDPDSIFEKMRIIIRWLPQEFLPIDYSEKTCANYMRLVNPDTGAKISGEAGKNIGRGGRSLMYFLDEADFLENQEAVTAAVSENTRVEIDISTVNKLGTVFDRRREAGMEWRNVDQEPDGRTAVFVMDWSENPLKTQIWYDTTRARYENEGLLHLFESEINRNAAASVFNTVIKIEWIKAAIGAAERLGLDMESGNWYAGLDVADSGGDKNAIIVRRGIRLRHADQWGASDPGATARRAIDLCASYCVERQTELEMMYDAIGIGSNVKSEGNRLESEGKLDKRLKLWPWFAGAGVLRPKERIIKGDGQSPFNEDFFDNLKAQAWWHLRVLFYNTFQAISMGRSFQKHELISIDPGIPYLDLLVKELAQVQYLKNNNGQIVIDKAPDGAKSPNLADAAVMCYFPVIKAPNIPIVGYAA